MRRPVTMFILSGQSNMQGQGEGPALYDVPKQAGWEYHLLENHLSSIAHPCGEDISVDDELLLASAHKGYGGLMPAFAAAYYDETRRKGGGYAEKACYVHCAKGATTVAEWLPDTKRYRMLVKKSCAAAECLSQEGYEAGHRCVVWLQGESDGIVGTTQEVYRERLTVLANGLQRDAGVETFMIIRVARFHNYPVEPIMAAQEELCKTDSRFVMLTRITSTFTINNGLMQGDTAPFHYTNAGYDLAGEAAGRYAAQYLHRSTLNSE